MVKNSGQKNRAKQYAAEHGITYQQAREALDAQHTQEALAALLAECGPASPPLGNLPFGKGENDIMQWVNPTNADDGWNNAVSLRTSFDHGYGNPIEIVGDAGSGKTTVLNRMIAYRATEDPAPRSIMLYAGEREFGSACARWKEWPQVVVIGPEGQVGGTSANVRDEVLTEGRGLRPEGHQVLRVFDDWFTGKNGLVSRYTRDQISRLPWSHPIIWRARVAGTASVAAFRPGHVSHLDESEEIRGTFHRGDSECVRGNPEVFSRGFIARDEFVFDPAEDSDPPSSETASMVIVPDGETPYRWEARLDGRRLGLPTIVHAGPGQVMYAEEPTTLTEYTAPEKVSNVAEFQWLQRSSGFVDVDFPFSEGPRNESVRQKEGNLFHAFPSLDVFPLDMDSATEKEVDATIEKALAAYWAIGERGARETGA